MSRRFSGNALTASAFVLGGLVLLQAGRLPENPAIAADSNVKGDFTVLTARSGRGDEITPNQILYVIDSRNETMLVYEVEDARRGQITLRSGGALPALFARARR